MKFLLDQSPLLVFFAAYLLARDSDQALYLATALAIVASLIQVPAHRLIYGRYDKSQVITLLLLLVLGGLTLALRDKRFIMWKPTAVYWLFAALFLGSQYIGRQNLTQRMLGQALDVPLRIWRRANASWVVFFLLMGIANLYVAFNFSEAFWVKYKVIGATSLFFVFTLVQVFYLSRFAHDPGPEKG
jgi:intracellular septation protein